MEINTDTTIIINWFDKETLESVVGRKMSDEEFEEFKNWVEDSSMYDEGSSLIRQYFYQWDLEKETEAKQKRNQYGDQEQS